MPGKHLIQLDGLRFYAVFMIMVAHWLQWQWGNKILSNIPFVHGVVLFFVLSGFLISKILLSHTQQYDATTSNKGTLLKTFYIRRSLRIFPIYYVTLFFLLIINFEDTRKLYLWLFSYTSNIYQSLTNGYIGSFNHLWSLAVEEQFYLVWPILLLFTKRRTLPLIIFSIVLALCAKAYLFMFYNNWSAESYLTICCMHALGLGSLLAYVSIHYATWLEKITQAKWLLVSGALYLLLLGIQIIFNLVWYKHVFDEFMFAIVCVFIVARAAAGDFKGLSGLLLENKFVLYSGKISYGLYVYHLFIPVLVAWLFPSVIEFNHQYAISKYLLFVLYYVITFGLAHVSYTLIERPINNLKKKFQYGGEE